MHLYGSKTNFFGEGNDDDYIFGHRDAPDAVEQLLECVLIELIECKGARHFYVGNQGAFDSMAAKVLHRLGNRYPEIRCFTVLAYMPRSDEEYVLETIFPEGLETVPRRYAIDRRNRWMVNQADVVIVYVKHSAGGAASFRDLALRKKKRL